MRMFSFGILLLLTVFYLTQNAYADCINPAGVVGSVYFSAGGGCATTPGMVCSDYSNLLGSMTTGLVYTCENFCEGFPTATCCEWSDGDGACRVYETGSATANLWGSTISDAGDCIAGGAGYNICNGLGWDPFLISNVDLGACSKLGAMEYDSTAKRYMVCNGTHYRAMECYTGGGGSCITYGACTKDGAINFSSDQTLRWCDGTNWLQFSL